MIKKFNGERSIYAIYHMLQGKKSSQTIQDAHLYGLTNLFGIMPHVTRLQLQSIIETLESQHWIQPHEKPEMFIITTKGKEQLANSQPIPSGLNGYKYQNVSHLFWGRLNLLIQTVSYIVHNQTRFYPIQRDSKIQQAVKLFLHKNKNNRENMSALLFEELVQILELQTDLDREIFVRKLTGHNRVGDTYEQIAQSLDIDPWYVRLLFLECIHTMIEEIERNSKQYPLLSDLISDVNRGKLTHSTQITLQLLKEGRSMVEIANIRRLKVNTIEDHLVEIVLADSQFPIQQYVPAEMEEKIRKAAYQLQTKQLKIIKQWLGDDNISFFQIRLVLAKVGDNE